MPDVKCRILYVDDHHDSSEMFKLILSDFDYEVEKAHSLDEAVRLAATKSFDLYVVDKRLPDGSGLDLVKKLNQLTPDVPTVVYTGDAYELHRQEALAAGANAYVAKPDIERLLETVHAFLSQSKCAAAAT